MEEERGLPDPKDSRIGVDRDRFLALLMAILEGQPAAQAAPPAPSDLNQWIDFLGGYEGNLPGRGQTGPGPSPGILRHMLENSPINAGPPPGPEMVGPGPGLGLVNPDLGAPLPAPLGPAPDVPEGFQIQAPQQSSGQPLSPEALDKLAAMLERRPELMAMQTPEAPTREQEAQMLAVAIELANEQQAAEGQPPIMPPDVGQGARGFGDWTRGEVAAGRQPPLQGERSIAKKAREAQGTIANLPDFLQEALRPDAAQRIAENPGGRLTERAQEVLQTPGPPRDLGSAETEQQRTEQLDFLLGAGPDRSSLLGNVGPGESALAAQMGGLPEFATRGGMARDPQMTTQTPEQQEAFLQFLMDAAKREGYAGVEEGNPGASRYLRPEAGMDPVARRIYETANTADTPEQTRTYVAGHGRPPDVSGASQTAEQIAEANRGVFSELLSQVLPEWGATERDKERMPTLFAPEERRAMPDQTLVEQILAVTRARERGETWANFPPDLPVSAPLAERYGTRLDAEVGNPPLGYGKDVLEGQPGGRDVGLDEAGNLRLGGPGGQIISARPVDLGPSTPIDTNVPDLDVLMKILGGMRQVDLGPLPKGPGVDVGMDVPLPMPGPGMTAPELPQVPGGMRPFPGGPSMPETPPGLDFLQFLLGPAGMALGRR